VGRPVRIQQPGAIYHVTAQANRSEALFLDSTDRRMFFLFLCRTVDHHDWHVHAWCALTTHYHLLITTPRGDLAAGMHRLQSRYAHWFNHEHAELGHLFRRRYGARHVQTEEHLRWCYRYIALNPVKAGLCERPEQWRWSSFAWLFGRPAMELPSAERHLFRHFGQGEAGRARLRRYVETGL
jgi:putative transposase